MSSRPSLDQLYDESAAPVADSRPSLDSLFKETVTPKKGALVDFMSQGAKGFAEGMHKIPGVRQFMDLNPEVADAQKEIGEPEGGAGKVGKFVGEGAAFIPAFEAAGPLGVGAQEGAGAYQEGKGIKEAAKEGAISTVATYSGGKVLEGAGKLLSNIPKGLNDASARLYDWMVKLPNKAFKYSKDPMGVFTKEKVTGNSITKLHENFSNRLEERTQQLQDAIKGSDKTVDVSKVISEHLDKASNDSINSLQDRQVITNKLETLQKKIGEQYGDLSNLPVQKAIKLKRQLANDFPFSGDPEGNILAKTAHKMYHDIDAAVDVAHPEIAELNQRVSGLIDITKASQNRMAVEARSNPIGFIGTLLGVAVGGHMGGVVGGVEAGAGIALAAKAASSPAVLSRVAATLAHLSELDKVNLFKAAPWFKEVAQKASDFVKQQSPELSMAGKVGVKPDVSVVPEVIDNRMKQVGFNPQEPRPGVQQPENSPVINQPPSPGLALPKPETTYGPITSPREKAQNQIEKLKSMNDPTERSIQKQKIASALNEKSSGEPGFKMWDKGKEPEMTYQGQPNSKQASDILRRKVVGGAVVAGAALSANKSQAAEFQKVNDDTKQNISDVENFGKTKGNWAHLTPVVYADLRKNKMIDNSISMAKANKDPAMYEHVVSQYLKRMDSFGVPESEKWLWWRAPAEYKKTGGDVNKIADPKLRRDMQNRVKNENDYSRKRKR